MYFELKIVALYNNEASLCSEASRGRHMDAYVDDLFDPVLDHGPTVCSVHDHSFIQFKYF